MRAASGSAGDVEEVVIGDLFFLVGALVSDSKRDD